MAKIVPLDKTTSFILTEEEISLSKVWSREWNSEGFIESTTKVFETNIDSDNLSYLIKILKKKPFTEFIIVPLLCDDFDISALFNLRSIAQQYLIDDLVIFIDKAISIKLESDYKSIHNYIRKIPNNPINRLIYYYLEYIILSALSDNPFKLYQYISDRENRLNRSGSKDQYKHYENKSLKLLDSEIDLDQYRDIKLKEISGLFAKIFNNEYAIFDVNREELHEMKIEPGNQQVNQQIYDEYMKEQLKSRFIYEIMEIIPATVLFYGISEDEYSKPPMEGENIDNTICLFNYIADYYILGCFPDYGRNLSWIKKAIAPFV